MTKFNQVRALVSIAVLLVLTVPVHLFATGTTEDISETPEVPETAPANAREILWLARAVQSETNRKEEMLLVAWSIRNRVEHGFRGNTYEEVVLASGQYSGLHAGDPRYETNISLDYGDDHPVWLDALEVAEAVYYADDSVNPLSSETRHFYSPHAVSAPDWAIENDPVLVIHDDHTGKTRFAFYESIR